MSSLPPPRQPAIRVTTTSGRIDVVAEDRPDVDVAGDADITRTPAFVTVSARHSRLRIRVPVGSDLVIGTSSGRVTVVGAAGNVSITTESGKVSVAEAATVDVRSASSALEIGHCRGGCRVQSRSGSIAVRSCGAVDAATTSGKISLREVRGVTHAHCASGRIDIELAEAHAVDAETVSGRISVSVPPGVSAAVVEAVDQPPAGADCVVAARSVSGRISVVQR